MFEIVGYGREPMDDAMDRLTATLSQLRPREITSRRPGRITLRVATPDAARDVEFVGPRVTIGAHLANAISLEDDTTSGVHCELCLTDDGAILRDLGSKNGTWLAGGVRVHEVLLPPGGSFIVGNTSITLHRIDAIDVAVSTSGRFGRLHGHGTKMGELFSMLERLASLPVDVLLTGEFGTGKEFAAREIHDRAKRSGPFVVVDCATLDESTVDVDLFGREGDHSGFLMEAQGGTLFLREIGELSLELQPKLLRALDRHEFRRPGDVSYTRLDARVIASTQHDLVRMVGEGRFRDDLYFGLAEVMVEMPPLRARGSADISMLADLFLEELAREQERVLRFTKSAHDVLVRYPWPGNVRQLHNVVRYVSIWSESHEIGAEALPPMIETTPSTSHETGVGDLPLLEIEQMLQATWNDARRKLEKIYATRLLKITSGNQSEAARRAGMSRSAFRELAKRGESTGRGEE